MRPTIVEARQPDTTSPFADPAARLAARLIDGVAPAMPAVALMPIGVAIGSPWMIRVGVLSFIAATLILLPLNLWWLHRYGQTLGKRLLGLRIVRSSGERAGLARILGLRIVLPLLLGSIPFVGWIFDLANALFIFSFERRCLHDRIADTIVVAVGGTRAEHRVPDGP